MRPPVDVAALADAGRAALAFPNLLALLALVVAAGWTAGGPWRRRSGLVVGALALLPAWLLPADQPLVRGVSALFAFVGVMRVVDLRQGAWTLGERLVHVASVADTRRVVRAPRRLDTRRLLAAGLWGGVALAGAVLLRADVPLHAGIAFWGWRWGTALVLVYAAVEAVYALLRAEYAALGFETGCLHDAPFLSRSVQELWGDRWARPVNVWLRETFFRPWVRRRRPVVGGLLAFAVSAGFHAYVIAVALGAREGWAMACCMFGYFMLQALGAVLERPLGVRRWPAWRARLWTVAWMLGTAPVFLEPAARVVVGAPR